MTFPEINDTMTIAEINNTIKKMRDYEHHLISDKVKVIKRIIDDDVVTGSFHMGEVTELITNPEKKEEYEKRLNTLYKMRDDITFKEYGMTWDEKETIRKRDAKAKRYKGDIRRLQREIERKTKWLEEYEKMAK